MDQRQRASRRDTAAPCFQIPLDFCLPSQQGARDRYKLADDAAVWACASEGELGVACEREIVSSYIFYLLFDLSLTFVQKDEMSLLPGGMLPQRCPTTFHLRLYDDE